MTTLIRNYRDLTVWQRAIDLAAACYQWVKRFPAAELYGLTAQIQRAVVSIPANIAEEHGRSHIGDYFRHLSIANGSLNELETHLYLAVRLGYLREPEIEPALKSSSEIGRMLSTLMAKLRARKR